MVHIVSRPDFPPPKVVLNKQDSSSQNPVSLPNSEIYSAVVESWR